MTERTQTSVKKPPLPTRADVAAALPGILIGVGMFFWVDEGLAGRLIMALFGGFLVQGMLLLGYLVAMYFVGSVAGDHRNSTPEKGLATTGALLLAAAALFLGQYGLHKQRAQIERCLRQELSTASTLRETAAFGPGDIIYRCIEDRGGGGGSGYSDDY